MTTETMQWRAQAAVDADQAATTAEQFVDQTRRDVVRQSLAVFHLAHVARTDRRTYAARLLADSVEKQARFSGLGRITIPVGVVA